MDIGILSVRNLRGVSWKRSILWFLLTMSSIPLHLLFVFPTITSLPGTDSSQVQLGRLLVIIDYELRRLPRRRTIQRP